MTIRHNRHHPHLEVVALEKLTTRRMDDIEHSIRVAHEDLVRVPTELMKSISALRDLQDEKFNGIKMLLAERDVRLKHDADTASANMKTMFAERDVRLAHDEEYTKLMFAERNLRLTHDAEAVKLMFVERDARIKHDADNAREAMKMMFAERDVRLKHDADSAREAMASQDRCQEMAVHKSEAAFSKQLDQLHVLINQVRDSLNLSATEVKERVTRIESNNQGRTEQQVSARDEGKLWTAVIGAVLGAVGTIAGMFIGRA